MSLLQGIVLGIVQGITEFLPISSSAHLVLVPWLLGWHFDPEFAFVFDVLVQMGTLLAVIAVQLPRLTRLALSVWLGLRRGRPLADPESRLAWLVILATIPAAVAGAALHDAVEAAFGNPAAVSGFLLVTAAMLLTAERLGRPARPLETLGWEDAVILGLAQALALFPGISRSGSTIAAGLGRGLLRPEAARASFLMVIPIMAGAGLVGLRDLAAMPIGAPAWAALGAGFLTSAVVGYLSIRWLLAFLATHRLTVFAAYCLVIGLAGLALAWSRA